MHEYTAPGPVRLSAHVPVADLTVLVGEGPACRVEVRPREPSRAADVAAAEAVTITRSGDVIGVGAPMPGRFGRTGAVRITALLPPGSHVEGAAATGVLRTGGELGSCVWAVGTGEIAVDAAVTAELRTGTGHIAVGRVALGLTAVTGSGNVRVGEAVAGEVRVTTRHGRIDVGVRAGSRVRTRLSPGCGRLIERLDAGRPEGAELLLEIGAEYGDVRLTSVSPATAV